MKTELIKSIRELLLNAMEFAQETKDTAVANWNLGNAHGNMNAALELLEYLQKELEYENM
jgi:hypothetical protein